MKRINITCPACGSKAYLRPASVVYGDKAPDPDAKYYVCGRYIPIEKIEHGVIYTRNHRYVKVVEVVPVNFLLRSAREQRSIIYSFISYLKIAPVKVQFKALTKRADINRHLDMRSTATTM